MSAAQQDEQVAQEGVGAAAKAVSESVSGLVRAEIDLAKAELTAGAKAKASGVAMLVVTAVLAWLGVQGLLIAAGFALALVLPGWAAALIVAGVLLLLGAIIALVGVRQLRKPFGLDTTKAQASEDQAWVKERLGAPQTSEQIREDVAWTKQRLAKR